MTFQEIVLELQAFWSKQGCAVVHPYDLEKGAGTFNPGGGTTNQYKNAREPRPGRTCWPSGGFEDRVPEPSLFLAPSIACWIALQ